MIPETRLLCPLPRQTAHKTINRSSRHYAEAVAEHAPELNPPVTMLHSPAITDRWRSTNDGGEISGLLMNVRQNAMSHPGYMRRPASENPPPSMRIGMRIPCQPLGSTLATSDIRVSFLAFLSRLPIRHLLATLTTIDSAKWTAQDGRGRFNFGAVLAGQSEAAPAAWARLLLPQANGPRYGQDPESALLILHIEPRTSDGNPAPPVALPAWHGRLVQAIALPAVLAKFLTRDLELATTGTQATQIAVSLEAPHSLAELVDTRNITALPGSPATNSFTAWAVADPSGQSPADLAQLWLRDMCDYALYLDGYEPVLATLSSPHQSTDPESSPARGPEQAETTIEIRAASASAAVDRLSQSPTRPLAGAKSGKGRQSSASTTRSSSEIAAHMRAYVAFTEATLADLETVSTADTARAFATMTAQKVRDMSARNPEFYAGEFFDIFKDAAVAKSQAEIAECRQAVDDAKAEAAAGTAELQERLNAARAMGDHQAVHEVWREREIRQAAVQAKIDEATKRIDPIGKRLDACNELATALGLELS
jgi:hypothetical protein